MKIPENENLNLFVITCYFSFTKSFSK